MKLKNHSAIEIITKFKDIVINNNLVGKMKGIITDQGKEFSKWREMEIFTETQVYFCDPSKSQTKTINWIYELWTYTLVYQRNKF